MRAEFYPWLRKIPGVDCGHILSLMFVETICVSRCWVWYTRGCGSDWNTWMQCFGNVSLCSWSCLNYCPKYSKTKKSWFINVRNSRFGYIDLYGLLLNCFMSVTDFDQRLHIVMLITVCQLNIRSSEKTKSKEKRVSPKRFLEHWWRMYLYSLKWNINYRLMLWTVKCYTVEWVFSIQLTEFKLFQTWLLLQTESFKLRSHNWGWSCHNSNALKSSETGDWMRSEISTKT